MRLTKYLLFIGLGVFLFDYFGRPTPDYKVGECAIDKIHGDKRKVTEVREYIYKYCKIVDNKCNNYYSMRIKDFDRIMERRECQE